MHSTPPYCFPFLSSLFFWGSFLLFFKLSSLWPPLYISWPSYHLSSSVMLQSQLHRHMLTTGWLTYGHCQPYAAHTAACTLSLHHSWEGYFRLAKQEKRRRIPSSGIKEARAEVSEPWRDRAVYTCVWYWVHKPMLSQVNPTLFVSRMAYFLMLLTLAVQLNIYVGWNTLKYK